MVIDPKFHNLISYLDLKAISESGDCVYIIDSDLILRAYNNAWIDFARNNDGEDILEKYPLGSKIGEVGNEPIKSYIVNSYYAAIKKNKLFELDYECSSADIFRLYRQTAYPLVNSSGLIVSHHLIQQKPHIENVTTFSQKFLNNNDFVIQCMSCRKIQDPEKRNNWYWVPDLVKYRAHNVSHSICSLCIDHYFPNIKSEKRN